MDITFKESRADLRYEPALSDEKRIAGCTNAIVSTLRDCPSIEERHMFIDRLFSNYQTECQN